MKSTCTSPGSCSRNIHCPWRRIGAQGLAASRGHPEFYHETITWAYMILVNQRLQSDPEIDWPEFCRHNANLFEPDKAILKKYYRTSTLDSDFARQVFGFPDLPGRPRS